MATEVSNAKSDRAGRRAFPRKWILPAVAGLLLLAVVAAPFALSLLNYATRATTPSSQSSVLPGPPDVTQYPTAAVAGEQAVTGAVGSAMDVDATTTQPWDRMIIRTGTLQLTVKDVGDSIQRVRSAATAGGGYVFSSETRNEGEYTYATVTLYIPAANFDQVLPELRALGGQVTRVANETITSSDVTEEYTDLDSQLRNLKATEGRMLALQAKAERMEDVLSIDRELRSVQSEIERLQGRMNYLGKRAEMSTLTVYLSPAIAPAPLNEPQPSWEPLKAAEDAWNASLDLLGKATTGIITAIVYLWWLVPLLAIGVFLVTRVRRRTQPSGTAEANA